MVVKLNLPDGASCVGVFVNYQREEQKEAHMFTTTNCLINLFENSGVTISEDGSLKYIKRRKNVESRKS